MILVDYDRGYSSISFYLRFNYSKIFFCHHTYLFIFTFFCNGPAKINSNHKTPKIQCDKDFVYENGYINTETNQEVVAQVSQQLQNREGIVQ